MTADAGPSAGWELARGDVFDAGEALDAAAAAFEESRDALERLVREAPPDQVILTGCGSALSVASIAAPFCQGWSGVPTRALPASELLFRPERVVSSTSSPLLVAVSRSGRTTETILAARSFAARFPGRVVAVTCSRDEDLNDLAAVSFAATAAWDRALPQTRSYAAMLLLALRGAAFLGGADDVLAELDSAREVLEDSLAVNEDRACAVGADRAWRAAVFLGSGPLAGLAREGAIKLVEMAVTPAEAMPFLEVRHGPNAIVDERTLVVGLLSPDSSDAEAAVLRDLGAQGARTVALAPGALDAREGIGSFGVPASIPEALLPFAYLPILQLLALGRARAVGADPNTPPHVRHYVEVADLLDRSL